MHRYYFAKRSPQMRPVTRLQRTATNLQTDHAGAIDQNRQAPSLYNSYQE